MSDAGRSPVLPPGGTPYRVCFVCTGNICRSPMAEVVLRHLASSQTAPGTPGEPLAGRLEISSAGTGPWHDGEPMDPRAAAALAARGYADHGHVARQFRKDRLERLDLVLALDRRHRETLRSLAGPGRADGRALMLRSFDPAAGGEVDIADPFYDDDRFGPCLTQIEAACAGLVQALASAVAAPASGRPSSP